MSHYLSWVSKYKFLLFSNELKILLKWLLIVIFIQTLVNKKREERKSWNWNFNARTVKSSFTVPSKIAFCNVKVKGGILHKYNNYKVNANHDINQQPQITWWSTWLLHCSHCFAIECNLNSTRNSYNNNNKRENCSAKIIIILRQQHLCLVHFNIMFSQP